MKRQSLLCLFIISLLVMVAGCQKDYKEPDSPSLPTSFPRKQLIEMFTSQDCSYCPRGTQLISAAIGGNENKYVRLVHHYGDIYDDFTLPNISKLATDLDITFLPSMLYNRSFWDYEDENGDATSGKVMHPYYFSQFISQAVSTALVSVNISSAYDEQTRKSVIKVSGKNLGDNKDISLTVALKESGVLATQQDSYNTWAGWEEYVHCDVVRTYLNPYTGQALEFNGMDYEVSLDYELYKSYNPYNCSVVAYLTDNTTGEIINAEETPLVSGTEGGKDFEAKGVKAVKVSDNYPESVALPEKYSDVEFLTAQYYLADEQVNGHNVVEIMMLSSDLYQIKEANYIPLTLLYLVVDNDGSALPVGTFPISTSGEPNTVWAGARDVDNYKYYGSEFYLAKYSELNRGYISGFEWLLTSGSVTITENTITYEATTLTGSKVTGSFSGEITHFTEEEEMPRRKR